MSESLEPQKKAKKTALGRGLGSLLGENAPAFDSKAVATPSAEKNIEAGIRADVASKPIDTQRVWSMDIAKLRANAKQPRRVFNQQALVELAQSIKEQGVLQPIVARAIAGKDEFEIIAGERRWRAAQLAGLQRVPVILKNADDKSVMELALIENIQREDLNPIEEAEAYSRLISEYQMTQQQVADKVGKERATVANALRLLGLAPEVRNTLALGEISVGHAKVLLGLVDPKQQKSLAEKVKSQRLSVRELERQIAQINKGRPKTDADILLAVDVSKKLMAGLSDELQKILGTKVLIDYTKGKGKLSIHFYSVDELNEIVDNLKGAWGS